MSTLGNPLKEHEKTFTPGLIPSRRLPALSCQLAAYATLTIHPSSGLLKQHNSITLCSQYCNMVPVRKTRFHNNPAGCHTGCFQDAQQAITPSPHDRARFRTEARRALSLSHALFRRLGNSKARNGPLIHVKTRHEVRLTKTNLR